MTDTSGLDLLTGLWLLCMVIVFGAIIISMWIGVGEE